MVYVSPVEDVPVLAPLYVYWESIGVQYLYCFVVPVLVLPLPVPLEPDSSSSSSSAILSRVHSLTGSPFSQCRAIFTGLFSSLKITFSSETSALKIINLKVTFPPIEQYRCAVTCLHSGGYLLSVQVVIFMDAFPPPLTYNSAFTNPTSTPIATLTPTLPSICVWIVKASFLKSLFNRTPSFAVHCTPADTLLFMLREKVPLRLASNCGLK